MSLIDTLHRSLSERPRPEDVALTITRSFEFSSLVDRKTKTLLRSVATHGGGWSSMAAGFEKASNLSSQIQVARELFPTVEAPLDPDHVEAVEAYVGALASALRIEASTGEGYDFWRDRANRERRVELELPKGHRAYNKRFRLLVRMAAKHRRWVANLEARGLAQAAKSRLASQIERDDLTDPLSACFIAYFTARSNVRSVFTSGKQDRPFDEVCDALFRQLGREANWWAIAHVYPATEVLEHLRDAQQGRFLAMWYSVMETAARVLAAEVAKSRIDLEGMVVRRGNDSSTWNQAAGAFNKARDGWINALHSLGAEELLDRFAPGKALRLIAADVAWLHRRKGEATDPVTLVWASLPKPWAVIRGEARCDRAMIEDACRRAGVEGRGWVAPRPKSVAAWRPTPELVHGVQVGSAGLAMVLKELGFFGGPSKAKPASKAPSPN